MPFSRRYVTAASTSPPVSVSAFLQSIMPAPVRSRRALTSLAEIGLSLTSVTLLPRSLRQLGQSWVPRSARPVLPRPRFRCPVRPWRRPSSAPARRRGRLFGLLLLADGLGGTRRRRVEHPVLDERVVGERLAVLGGGLGRLRAGGIGQLTLGAVGALAHPRVGLRASAGLDGLGDLGLGVLARLALAAGDELLLALALGLLGGLLARLLLGLEALALLLLAAGLLRGLLARALLLGAEDALALGDDAADGAGDQRARADGVVVARDDV